MTRCAKVWPRLEKPSDRRADSGVIPTLSQRRRAPTSAGNARQDCTWAARQAPVASAGRRDPDEHGVEREQLAGVVADPDVEDREQPVAERIEQALEVGEARRALVERVIDELRLDDPDLP